MTSPEQVSPLTFATTYDKGALIRATLETCLIAALPSFLRCEKKKPRTIHSTAYLDGLRGVAALFVAFDHYVAQFFPYISKGYLSQDKSEPGAGENNRFVQLPIIRVFYNGWFMVSIFFVISGYVLSYKALGLSRCREYIPLLRSLSSSVLRRWLRLMLPALTSSLIAFLVARSGLGTILYTGWDSLPPPTKDRTPTEAYLPTQEEATVLSWLKDASDLTHPFNMGQIRFPLYDFPLWTMPIEYTGSMIVFVIVLAISFARPAFRLAIPAGMLAYSFLTGKWDWALFLSGIILADQRYRRASSPDQEIVLPLASRLEDEEGEEVDLLEKPNASIQVPLYLKIATCGFNVVIFFLAIYIGAFPGGSETTPGYRFLTKLTPNYLWGFYAGFFYPAVGGIMLVAVLDQDTFLQRIFTTQIAQYLGDISLSLYMLHSIVLVSLGNWLVPICLNATSRLGSWNFTVGMTMALSCCAILTFWIADVFWRLVDMRSVEFARWVSVKITKDV